MKFYTCSGCNQVYIKLVDTEKPMMCCELETIELTPENTDEAHKPIIRKIGNFVTLSLDPESPMIDVHQIQYMFLETNQGFQFKAIPKGSKPEAKFILNNDEHIVDAYVYCNIHWLSSYQRPEEVK